MAKAKSKTTAKAKSKTTAKAKSKTNAAPTATTNNGDTVAKLRRDTAALCKRERSVAESWLKLAHRVRDNFNVADRTVYQSVREAVLAGCKQYLGEKGAKNRTAEVMAVARAAKLPAAKDAPKNLQHYAAKCRKLNPTQKRATGGKTRARAAQGKTLTVAEVLKKLNGQTEALKKHPMTEEAREIVRSVEDLLISAAEVVAKQEAKAKQNDAA